MVVVIFRSRVRPEHADEYSALVEKMAAIARAMPGYNKSYISEDGESVSIHEWQSAEHLRAWREHPDHAKAQELGRSKFYEDYTLYVCEDPRQSRHPR